jgi:hypothetical protein
MAEAAPITCPDCKKKFKTKADVRGKRIRCPFCTASFIAPMLEDEPDEDEIPTFAPAKDNAPADAPAAPAAEPPTVTPAGAADMEEGDDPYAVTKLDLAPRCPNCAYEMPSATAVVCLNCGYNTLTREWGKTEKTIGVSMGRHLVHLLPGLVCLFLLLLCMGNQLIYSVYWPFWVAGTWLEWSDHESLRMWSTMIVGLTSIFALGRFCYRRFFVKPMPEEIEMD